jgi:pilus assembly protein FimV
LFLPHTGFTLGLGEIEVNSALNQTLNADIELLSASIEDTENLIIKLASRKEFLRAGLDRPYLLNDLRFKAEEINGVPYIKVSSSGPIREPYLNFLLEIDWPNGHLLREYTILLDPPVFMTQAASTAFAPVSQTATASGSSSFRPSSAGASNIVPVAVPGATTSSRPMARVPAKQIQSAPMQQAAVTQATTRSSWVPAPAVKQQAVINPQAGSYRIKAGDTAWSLADAMRPDQSITVAQMMIAMLRANPESFINENVNGLKRGYILRVPDYEQIVAINQAEARAMVREQSALWRQYQQSQSGGQPVSAMEARADADTGSDGKTVTGEEDDAYLEIVSAGSGSSMAAGKDPTEMTSAELRAELALARERVETGQVEKEALQQRINTLEQRVDKMKGMLSIEDEELSNVQALSAPAEAELAVDESLPDVAQEEPLPEAAPEEEDAEVEAIATSDTAEEEVVAEIPQEGTEAGEEEVLFADETSADSTEGVQTEESMAEIPEETETVVEEVQPVPSPIIDRAPEPDLITRLLNNPMMLAAAGGGLLLIAALLGLIIKRRKAASEAAAPLMEDLNNDLESIVDDFAEVDAEPLVGDEVLESDKSLEGDFDSDSTMILDSAEDTIITDEPSAAVEDDEPRDDVIAEADVYLAYGIYQQAEELLVQAITDNPERDDYRVKLAETHYASKNAEAFVDVANEIKKRTDGIDSPIWKKIMVMGQDLCADNPMFQGSMVGGLDVDAIAPDAPSMDFDLGENEVDEAPELEFDIGEAGAIDETVAVEDEFSLDIDASELDIETQDKTEEAAVEAEKSADLDDMDLGLDLDVDSSADETLDAGDIDLDFGLEDDSTAEEEVSLDLSDEIEAMEDDNSLDMELTEEAEPEATVVSSDLADEDEFDLSSLDDVDEISTKLDLARAYLDMGDHEGTRGILEEVLADGDDQQKQEANDLMAKLD